MASVSCSPWVSYDWPDGTATVTTHLLSSKRVNLSPISYMACALSFITFVTQCLNGGHNLGLAPLTQGLSGCQNVGLTPTALRGHILPRFMPLLL